MNWKQIKAGWQNTVDERWMQHPKHHLKNKKRERQNRKGK